MLSISQTELGYYCYEWISTENGPKIINYDYINIKNNLNNNDTLNNIINSFKPQLKDESNSLSISLNIKNINISSFKVDKHTAFDKAIYWYENNIIDSDFLKTHELYYYLIDNDNYNLYLVLSIDKFLKNKIINTSKKLKFKLIYLSLDIFSASISVRQLFKLSKNDSYFVWKVCNNNFNNLLYFKNDNLSGFINFKINNNKCKIYNGIASKKLLSIIESNINEIIINKKISNYIGKFFIYQTKKETEFINKVCLNTVVEIIDISKLFKNYTYSKYKLLPYVENGISLKGIDV